MWRCTRGIEGPLTSLPIPNFLVARQSPPFWHSQVNTIYCFLLLAYVCRGQLFVSHTATVGCGLSPTPWLPCRAGA